jgi:uncharacterized FlaG/YvyC family protein
MVDAVSASLPPALPAIGAATGAAVSAPAPVSVPGITPSQKPESDTGKKSKEFDNHALDQIAARLVALDSRLAISHDSVIQRFIYKFVNPNNGKVVQQYPQQMTLDSLHAMAEAYKRFLDERA